MIPYAIPTFANTFELPGRLSEPGVLLLHGFTGDTSEMRPLAECINRSLGLHCYAPLLPGHGVPPEELHGITDEHWLQSARQGFECIRQQHQRVIVVSFSMGAALAAIMLENTDAEVAFIAISPLIATRFPLVPFTPLVSRFMPWIYPLKFVPIDMLGIRGKILQYDPTLNLDDPVVIARLRNEVRLPVAVAEELRKVARRAIRAAQGISVSTLVVQGDGDLTLDPEGARRFYRNILATDKTLLTVADADHDYVKANRPGNAALLSVVEAWIRQHFANIL